MTGKAIRACADNYLGAKVVGLNVKHLYALTFGLGSACVAVAGCALVLLVDVTPPLGPYYTLLAFVIVIVGGLGSMGGALLGGVLIGVSEALAGPLHRALGEEHVQLRPADPGAAAAPAGPAREAGLSRRPRRARAARSPPSRCFPRFAGPYALSVATLILYFAYTGQAWNVMMGFAGQLSLGHALYVGVGAYAARRDLLPLRHRTVGRPLGGDRCSAWRSAW